MSRLGSAPLHRPASPYAALVCATLLAAAHPVLAQAQPTYVPGEGQLAARREFMEARFGLFVHWGVYSVLGDGEWVMNNQRIPVTAYENLPAFFDPHAFDARAWVAMVKDAGMKYITITSKHHDGFAMFDSKVSDWDIVDRTRSKRDVLKELADACHEAGIKLFFYYSQLDWHHPDYYPRGRTGQATGRPDSGDWNRYIDFMNAQLTELLTNYGPIAGIWFDGWWDRPEAPWRLDETYRLIHSLQPNTMVGSNHHVAPFPGEDFQMFEKDLPGANTAGFNTNVISSLPLETCETINGSWGFDITDTQFKSVPELIRYLVRAAGHDANFLLNVGPMPDGRIQPEFRERLGAMGDWLRVYGESIYGTRGGPVAAADWGVTTRKDGLVYLHVLDWSQPALAIGWDASFPVRQARVLRTGERVEAQVSPDGRVLVVSLPDRPDDLVDEVIVLETR